MPLSILLQKEDQRGKLSGLFDSVQSWLIPVLEEELEELEEKEQEFIRAIELTKPDRFLEPFSLQVPRRL